MGIRRDEGSPAIIQAICTALLAVCLNGCTTFTVEGDIPKTPDSKTKSETVHGSLYGFQWQEWHEGKCDPRKGLARVRFHTNAAYILASVVSLGLYVPQNVTWWCDGSKSAAADDDDIYDPDAN